jgi:hypothetical protein
MLGLSLLQSSTRRHSTFYRIADRRFQFRKRPQLFDPARAAKRFAVAVEVFYKSAA